MTRQLNSDYTRFTRLAGLPYLEARSASFSGCPFDKHTHDTLSIGVVESGISDFYYKGNHGRIGRGDIAVIPPDVVHACNPTPASGITYYMFYLSVDWVQKLIDEMEGRRFDHPSFSQYVIRDVNYFHGLKALYHLLANESCAAGNRLALDAYVYHLFSGMFHRYGGTRSKPCSTRTENRIVTLVKEYIAEHIADNVSLADLSGHAGVSSYHLLRVFRSVVGLPPHAYLLQQRIHLAKRMLATGTAISDVAIQTGFVDQSHFSKKFKRLVGATPRQYQAAVIITTFSPADLDHSNTQRVSSLS